ncbi:Myb-like DNA-binding domain containing protein [Histomonas meleagridis]|uniref:Myb-like DNA-binding domain containing protein n=1 Tax=Histomonas meleagridis TaxID=135588 RepID=UPI00355A12DF|nr:Myb-like DNA-binding domain containing protein [Histomonas meleagridis]KAH0804261.1 Myb-like DNA-binding domain containing protein [Histomonas meleagridis]
MFEVTTADQSLDCFSLSRKPLKIMNCNGNQIFTSCQTRLPLSQHLYEDCRNLASKEWEIEILPPSQTNAASFSTDDKTGIFSDHLNKDFNPFTIPESGPLFSEHSLQYHREKERPYYFCELPTTNMRFEPKIFYNEASSPFYKVSLPNCDHCGVGLAYPFYASVTCNLCCNCISQGFIPPHQSSLDFFKVEPPDHTSGGWTLAETNKLLSLVEDHGDDWNTIASLMKTRTPAECLLHFVRIPMYDPYYVADPTIVPPGAIPTDPNILPFIIAQDPVAAYVEFIHSFLPSIGTVIAEASQKDLEEVLANKSGMVMFNQVPKMLEHLLQLTGEVAGKAAKEEADVLIGMLKDTLRMLEREVKLLHREFEKDQKELFSAEYANVLRQNDDDIE